MIKLTKVLVVILVISIFITLSGCNKETNTANQNGNSSNQSNTVVASFVKSTKTVELSKLKHDEINPPKDYPSVAGIAVSGNTLFFCSGSDRPSKSTAPCLTYIEKLFSYNIQTKELKTIAEIDKGFIQIDWLNVDEDWLVYREINDEYGGPVRIYAMDRKSNIKRLVYEERGCTDCEGITSQHLFNLNLWKDFLIIPQFSFEPTKRDERGMIKDGIFHNSIKILDLRTNETKTIFDKSAPLASSGAIFSTSVNSSYLAFNYAENGTQSIYVYSFDSGELEDLLDVPLMSDAIGSNNYLSNRILLTEDNFIVFGYPENLKRDMFLTVIAPIENIKQMKSLSNEVPDYYLTWPQSESKDYIIWANRQNSTLYVINRNSGCLETVKLGIGYLWVTGDKLFAYGGTGSKESFIVIDLKENGL